MAAENKELERILNERAKHRGQWLTEDAVAYYQEKAKNCPAADGQDIGKRRALRREFQEKFGLLEIEAINILNGFHAAFYVEKYRRIKDCVPLQSNSAKNTLEEED